ncbi:hypothetical protein G4B88_009802 [Cannabis sativa]|uniref:Uncharacterized protein n=1 Tax=Cannabis sativa TaxID=3483 RepID=A0A7J6E2V6_CANSA|nr:hypothetical protein G4B88_009802 [Cannabis sativa]
MKVAITAGIDAHSRPRKFLNKLRVGSYTLGRRMLVTIRFHLLPQKSWSEEERSGSLNCGSSSSPKRTRARAAITAKTSSRKNNRLSLYSDSSGFFNGDKQGPQKFQENDDDQMMPKGPYRKRKI